LLIEESKMNHDVPSPETGKHVNLPMFLFAAIDSQQSRRMGVVEHEEVVLIGTFGEKIEGGQSSAPISANSQKFIVILSANHQLSRWLYQL